MAHASGRRRAARSLIVGVASSSSCVHDRCGLPRHRSSAVDLRCPAAALSMRAGSSRMSGGTGLERDLGAFACRDASGVRASVSVALGLPRRSKPGSGNNSLHRTAGHRLRCSTTSKSRRSSARQCTLAPEPLDCSYSSALPSRIGLPARVTPLSRRDAAGAHHTAKRCPCAWP